MIEETYQIGEIVKLDQEYYDYNIFGIVTGHRLGEYDYLHIVKWFNHCHIQIGQYMSDSLMPP